MWAFTLRLKITKDAPKNLKDLIFNELAIVALGGYGRNELFPGSDIVFYYNFVKKTKKIEEVSDFIAWLWTLNVKIGHSVRTIRDIEKITKSDLKEFTSHLSNRIIFCSAKKEAELTKVLHTLSTGWSKSKFFKAKKTLNLGFISFFSTQYNLEPDLKESPGCLRDFHTALWILEHCFEVSDLMECEKLNLFSKKDLLEINNSYCHIKSLRFLLNLHANSNRISFENQLLLADRSKVKASKKSSAVENFMRTFFLHAAKLSDFNEMVFQAYEDRNSLLKKPQTKNFYIFKDRLGIQEHIDLVKNPELVLESFIQIGRLKKINGLDFVSMRKLQEAVTKITAPTINHPEIYNQFIEILTKESIW